MDFESLFRVLPDFFLLFLPDYVFICTYRKYTSNRDHRFEDTAIKSVSISYIIKLIVSLIFSQTQFNEEIRFLFCVTLGYLLALIVIKIRSMDKSVGFNKWLGKVTGKDSIWDDLFNRNLGSGIRFYIAYKEQTVLVEGKVKYYESYSSGECSIVLKDYTIHFPDNTCIKPNKWLLLVNSQDISIIEAADGLNQNGKSTISCRLSRLFKRKRTQQ